ncbi:uncharacterized protein LOC131675611 [Phymastichus coffea]|uniref:uncharacterized protein LOC131675611 n=1 Tax=Phymastichus coffea TaxID=108790 RepID=UPI00273AF77F|nr:uncharacterized protein LOC131675611 [Phymastichus coffea]
MVATRTDIDDLVKFLYLRDALQKEAASKIAIFSATAENYKKAWKSLIDAYDRKRILIARHVDALLDTPTIGIATATSLSRLVDNTRQRLSVLKSINFKPDEKIVVRILERALPIDIRAKWEESLQLDEFPTLDEFFKFIDLTIYRLSTMETETTRIKREIEQKRTGESDTGNTKRLKKDSARLLMTAATTKPCLRCGDSHYLYRCPEYNKDSIGDRWAFIEEKRLCRNCLRKHEGTCNSGKCKKCNQTHHTSLHRNEQPTPTTSQA